MIQQLEVAAFATATAGRPMYAANRTVEPSADPVERLWQACTTLREQRGDGHVAALVTVGLVPPEADLLRLAVTGTADEVLRESRGWTDEAWAEARVRLAQRGLTDGQGATGLGNALRDDVERITDALAASALAVLTAEQRHELVSRLTPVATTIADSGLIPFPNPIGLDHTKDSRRRLAGRANTRT